MSDPNCDCDTCGNKKCDEDAPYVERAYLKTNPREIGKYDALVTLRDALIGPKPSDAKVEVEVIDEYDNGLLGIELTLEFEDFAIALDLWAKPGDKGEHA